MGDDRTGLQIPEEYREIATICTATEVEIGGRKVIGIADARALHKGMSVKSRYNDWIARRVIGNPEFTEGSDYEKFGYSDLSNQKSGRGGNRKPEILCRLALDAAKRLALAEHNEAGAVVRGYFIWVEAQHLSGAGARPGGPMTRIEIRQMMKDVLVSEVVEPLLKEINRLRGMTYGTGVRHFTQLDGHLDRQDLDLTETFVAVSDTKEAIDRQHARTVSDVVASLGARVSSGHATAVSGRLAALCTNHGWPTWRAPGRSGPRLFPNIAVRKWLDSGGAVIVHDFDARLRAKQKEKRLVERDTKAGQTNLFSFPPKGTKKH